ncbi:MAG: beta-ketoacyl-[acyl-carrier-protein] synthase II [Dehalococcoidia bacterium]|nr:beta-ketoacyl-[acyl-carrier-protein] synthase II [Dehalococcoidia bacterium]
MQTPRVVVTGMGTINPLGHSVAEFWKGAVAGKSAIAPIERFDASKFYVKVDAEVKGFDAYDYMDPKTADRNPRAVHFGVAAAQEAMTHAGIDMNREVRERVGVAVACLAESDYIVKQSDIMVRRGPRRVDPLFIARSGPSAPAMQIAMLFGAKGPNSSPNSLCASGADAIGTAANFIKLGHADVMLAGGSDSTLSPVGIAGLDILGALTRETDHTKACRPFDANRSGFVFGEGAGILVLESLDHAKARGANILAELAGAAWSFDAYDQTAPFPEAEAYAMKDALARAGFTAADVDYVNAHGTSTRLNDPTETKALKLALGEHAYKVPVSSTKSMIGHAITAAGATESIICIMTILNGVIHPTINYETPDPECDLDYVPNVAREAKVDVCLTDSFGLGGENSCLVFKRFNG